MPRQLCDAERQSRLLPPYHMDTPLVGGPHTAGTSPDDGKLGCRIPNPI